MSVELVPEEDLRAALRPYRADVERFEAAVREQIQAAPRPREDHDSESRSPLFRVAAAVLPWPLIAGGKVVGPGAKLSSLAMGPKLLGYAALPAISLFLLVGTALFSAAKIRGLQRDNHPDLDDEKEIRDALGQWWGRHKYVVYLVFAAVVLSPMIGSTWLLFLLLLVSCGALLCLLSGFAGLGVGNRLMIAQSCLMGLVFLGQATANPFGLRGDIHFVDQTLIPAVFFAGTLCLLPFVINRRKRLWISGPAIEPEVNSIRRFLTLCFGIFVADLLVAAVLFSRPANEGPIAGNYRQSLFAGLIAVEVAVLIYWFVVRLRKTPASSLTSGRHWSFALFYVCLVVPLITWSAKPILWPVTPEKILHHVESFEQHRHPFIDWRDWEIAASWTIEAGLDPDLSRARRLLDDATSHEHFAIVLASAFRVGLVRTDQIQRFAQAASLEQMGSLERRRRFLIPEFARSQAHPITSLGQRFWVIHALNQTGQLSSTDRDVLEQRLLTPLDQLDESPGDILETALRVTQLLDVIGRPVDRDQYREQVHEWLCEFRGKRTHYQISGGFATHKGFASSLQATSQAVELMQIYGIPEDLDLNWVRSYLRPHRDRRWDDKVMAAVTLDRLNRLPGVTEPTWLEIAYYERSLIAAILLVVFCIYATWSSPVVDPSSNQRDLAESAS